MTTLVVSPLEWEMDELELSAAAFHHLFRVRRLRIGELIRVVDGGGRARAARVERVDRASAILSLGESVPSNEPALEVSLLVAAPRPQRAGWLVEKATELGVISIRFITSSRTPRTYGASTVERLLRLARSAVEQSGRAVVPEVSAGHDVADIEQLIEQLDCCWVLDPGAGVTGLAPDGGATSAGVLVGPEGGWSPKELEALVAAGCHRAGLGRRILRVETSAVVAAAALLVTPSVDTL